MPRKDAQGLHSGVASTPEQFVQWNGEQPSAAATAGVLLDRPLIQMCDKTRLPDLLHNFVNFDTGFKKVHSHHQPFHVFRSYMPLGGVIFSLIAIYRDLISTNQGFTCKKGNKFLSLKN